MTYVGNKGKVNSVKMDNKDQFVITGSEDGSTRVYDLISGIEFDKQYGSGSVNTVVFIDWSESEVDDLNIMVNNLIMRDI